MAHISVSGGTSTQRKWVKKAAGYALFKLCGKRLSESLYVDVDLSETLEDEEGIGGYAQWEDSNHRPKDFAVVLATKDMTGEHYPLNDLITNTMHEMVHVKQYAKGELKDLIRPKTYNTRWLGKPFYKEDGVDYWDHPWEIEAYGREKGLTIRFLEQHGGTLE